MPESRVVLLAGIVVVVVVAAAAVVVAAAVAAVVIAAGGTGGRCDGDKGQAETSLWCFHGGNDDGRGLGSTLGRDVM